jgi:hypothetical protein
MGRNPKFQHLTDNQLIEKRKKYMRQYYLNNKNKEIKLIIPKKAPYLVIRKGLFILYFD